MRGRSKLTAKVVVLATVVLIIVACVSSIPGVPAISMWRAASLQALFCVKKNLTK